MVTTEMLKRLPERDWTGREGKTLCAVSHSPSQVEFEVGMLVRDHVTVM